MKPPHRVAVASRRESHVTQGAASVLLLYLVAYSDRCVSRRPVNPPLHLKHQVTCLAAPRRCNDHRYAHSSKGAAHPSAKVACRCSLGCMGHTAATRSRLACRSHQCQLCMVCTHCTMPPGSSYWIFASAAACILRAASGNGAFDMIDFP
jgi:hypothetical protein